MTIAQSISNSEVGASEAGINQKEKEERDGLIDLTSTLSEDDNSETKPTENLRILGVDLSGYSKGIQFTILMIGLFGTFIPYGYIQESIFKVDGFHWPLALTFIQYILYAWIGFFEGYFTGDTAARAPFRSYLRLSICLVLALILANKALVYLNYPTKVVLKSSKMIPVMVIGKVWFSKKYTGHQYLATFLLLSGIIMFSLADVSMSEQETSWHHVVGALLMVLSICLESLGQQFQEDTIEKYHCTERELIFYNSLIGIVCLAFITLGSGEFQPAFKFGLENPHVYMKICVFSVLGYFGTMFFLGLIRTSGVFIAMSVGIVRKLFTIILSFIFFPKPFTFQYVIASLLAFSGIGLNVYTKNSKEFDEGFRMIGRFFTGSPAPQPRNQREESQMVSVASS